MSDFPTRFDTPEAAYRGFFRADSAQNAPAWAAVMCYPHVRVSAAGRTPWYDTAEDYAARADWTARIATGWVRSEGVEPQRLHESAGPPWKVHLVGGWTRFNAADQPILSNRVTYILTKPGDSWGIQARFGVDSFGDDDPEAAAAATATVRRLADAHVAGDFATCAELVRLPLIVVGVGAVQRIATAPELTAHLKETAHLAAATDIRAVQVGHSGAVVATAREGGSAALILGKQEDGWKVAGISRIPS